MLVKHLRKEFYNLLFGKRVLILANFDVDSVCTSKILLELFRIDAIAYSFVPIDGLAELRKVYFEYAHTVQVVLMINCGMGIDILEILNQPKDKIFFVLDSHRPIHIANFYDETNQVRLLTLEDKIDIPDFDDIFRSEMSDSEEDEEEEEDEPMAESSDEENEIPVRRNTKRKRRELGGNRHKHTLEWEEKRHEVLFEYSQFRYFAPPSALLALELSWSLSRQDIQYVWWAIVALTDSLVMEKVPRREYTLKIAELHSHIARVSHSQNTPRDCLKVTFEKELCFMLYRHWNLYESIKMTPCSASVLKTWTLKGESRFHEMLGELGLPLNQCRQKFTAMELRFRRKVKDSFCLPVVKEKYKFDDVTVASFVAEIGFRSKFSAFDSQLSCCALLENPDINISTTEKYMEAFESLTKTSYDMFDKGLNLSKLFVKATFRQVQAFINMGQVAPRGGYLLAQVPEGAPDICYFGNPSCLTILAQFTQQAAVSSARSRRWASMPLVLVSPSSKDWHSVIGIKPLNFDLPKNLFGKLFETLAERMAGKVIMDAMDPHVIQVRADDKEQFLVFLEACML